MRVYIDKFPSEVVVGECSDRLDPSKFRGYVKVMGQDDFNAYIDPVMNEGKLGFRILEHMVSFGVRNELVVTVKGCSAPLCDSIELVLRGSCPSMSSVSVQQASVISCNPCDDSCG